MFWNKKTNRNELRKLYKAEIERLTNLGYITQVVVDRYNRSTDCSLEYSIYEIGMNFFGNSGYQYIAKRTSKTLPELQLAPLKTRNILANFVDGSSVVLKKTEVYPYVKKDTAVIYEETTDNSLDIHKPFIEDMNGIKHNVQFIKSIESSLVETDQLVMPYDARSKYDYIPVGIIDPELKMLLHLVKELGYSFKQSF